MPLGGKTQGNDTYSVDFSVALPSASHAAAARSKSRAKRSLKDAEITRAATDPELKITAATAIARCHFANAYLMPQ